MRFQFGTVPFDNNTEGATVVAPVYGVFDSTANDSDKSFTVPAGFVGVQRFKGC